MEGQRPWREIEIDGRTTATMMVALIVRGRAAGAAAGQWQDGWTLSSENWFEVRKLPPCVSFFSCGIDLEAVKYPVLSSMNVIGIGLKRFGQALLSIVKSCGVGRRSRISREERRSPERSGQACDSYSDPQVFCSPWCVFRNLELRPSNLRFLVRPPSGSSSPHVPAR